MSIPEEVWNAVWHGNWQDDEGTIHWILEVPAVDANTADRMTAHREGDRDDVCLYAGALRLGLPIHTATANSVWLCALKQLSKQCGLSCQTCAVTIEPKERIKK